MTVECANCHTPRDDNVARCPECGDTRKIFHEGMLATVHGSMTVSMTIERIRNEMEKNWPLIAVLIGTNLLSWTLSYLLSGWRSVLAAVFSALVLTFVGYYAITRKITITRES